MYICKEVLTKEEVKKVLEVLKKSEWKEGTSLAGKQHKNNQELHLDELSLEVGQRIQNHPTVIDKAFILQLHKPRFNAHKAGEYYKKHVDLYHQNQVRTDWSMTLFLTEPDTYEGGELVIHDSGATPEKIKLAAGDMILYPSGYIHEVAEVTKGERICAISWAQSAIEDKDKREATTRVREVMLALEEVDPEAHKENILKLSSVFNKLMKSWGQW